MARVLAVVVLLCAVAFVVVQLLRPVPSVRATASIVAARMPGTPVPLAWPSQGEAAIGVEGVGVLADHGAQTETPLASLGKMMTAYVVLRSHPLAPSGSGPAITVTAADVANYKRDLAAGDSVVEVRAGERLTEIQALEALLIPSGDNIATLLAEWDAGSVPKFVAQMNGEAKRLGLADTHYSDTSGVAVGTESTAADQVQLALAAMRIPAFASVVGMAQVTLPVAGLQYNVDSQLGTDGIIGIKTGFTTAAGGCFVFAATPVIGGTKTTVVGAVLDQTATPAHPSAITDAFTASRALLTSADRTLERATVVHEGVAMGHLDAPWAAAIGLDATRSITLTGFPGQLVETDVTVPHRITAPVAAGHELGSAWVAISGARPTLREQLDLVTSRPLPSATLAWRLTRL